MIDVSEVLTQYQRQRGWGLKEDADHVVMLYFQGIFVARFSQTGTLIQDLHHHIGEINLN